jgi:hypothetical protein
MLSRSTITNSVSDDSSRSRISRSLALDACSQPTAVSGLAITLVVTCLQPGMSTQGGLTVPYYEHHVGAVGQVPFRPLLASWGARRSAEMGADLGRKLLFRLRVLGKEADDRAVSDQHHGDGRRDDGANAEVVGRERHATAPVITAMPHNEN